jgi:hypothetical protein
MSVLKKWSWLGLTVLFGALLAGFSMPVPHFSENLRINGPRDGDVEAVDVHIDYPRGLRVGDDDQFVLRAKLMARKDGQTVGAKEVMLSAVLSSAFIVGNQKEIHEILRVGEEGNFSWQIRGREWGAAEGTVWLTLNLAPDAKGDPAEDVLLAKPILIYPDGLAGLPAWVWRTVGGLGMAGGLLWGGWNFLRQKGMKKVRNRLE